MKSTMQDCENSELNIGNIFIKLLLFLVNKYIC